MPELIVLGTAAQVPTRDRNVNGYLLRWGGEGLLFDPGEGTQRQMALARVPASAITRILVTHFHGDHCLGLPGVLQRIAMDGVSHPVDVYFPASGRAYFDRLRSASLALATADIRAHEVSEGGPVDIGARLTLVAQPLDHLVDALGWRLQEPDGRRLLPERLEAAGVRGPDIGLLQRRGVLEVGGRSVTLHEVSEHRRGQAMAFVMDTRPCEGAAALAEEADLLVCESTFLDRDAALAEAYGHLTAGHAGRLAAGAAVRRLVLTHYSARYSDEAEFEREAAAHFPDVVAVRDLDRVPVPPR